MRLSNTDPACRPLVTSAIFACSVLVSTSREVGYLLHCLGVLRTRPDLVADAQLQLACARQRGVELRKALELAECEDASFVARFVAAGRALGRDDYARRARGER